MSDTAQRLAESLLEAGDATPPPRARPDVEKWNKVHGSMRELEALHRKRDELYRELAFSVRWAHALAQVGYHADEAQGIIRASELSSVDHGLFPHESAGRVIHRSYAMKYPGAVVGAQLKAGGSVLFKEPIAAKGQMDPPTYEEFKAAQDKSRQERQERAIGGG